jgi:hypothetical protein
MADPFNARDVLNLCNGNGRLWRGADLRLPLHFDATQAVSLFGQKGRLSVPACIQNNAERSGLHPAHWP